MKTNLFRKIKFPLFWRGMGGGFLMCVPVILAAQNGVTVSNLAIDAGTVTFNVSWEKPMPVALWSDTVWVFVDYNDAGVMKRLPVTGASVSAGTVTKIPNNDKGVWVEGNARTNDSFSAKVELFTEIKDLAGACAYASNYPPVGEYTSASEISFTGTPEYKVVLERSDNSTYTATVGKDESLLIPSGEVVLSFTDKTGAPGLLNCIPSSVYTLSGADVCKGADVTLTLSGSESGWRYQLYKDNIPVGSETEGTGSALAFSEASTDVDRFSYTVRTVDATGVKCEMQVSNVHAIAVNPVPSITRSGGDASQSVIPTTAINAIVHTATNSATISLTGGGFPAGVGGMATGSSFTISGTPTETGTFDYSLTAAVGGCTSTAAGTLTVLAAPPGAASTYIWVIDSQFWSASLQNAQVGCTATTDFDTTNPPTVAYYRSSDLFEGSGYLYNWKCVVDYATQLCPSPWRVPTQLDFVELDYALGGTGVIRREEQQWVEDTYYALWGAIRGGESTDTTYYYRGTAAWYWTASHAVNHGAVSMQLHPDDTVKPNEWYMQQGAMQVRCVH